MVLPFKTTPMDLVQKLGKYVIVNRIKESTINEAKTVTVSFKLEMDEIPAGEPFLIKSASEMDWDVISVTEEANAEGPIDGDGPEAPAPAMVLVNDNSIAVAAADLNGEVTARETAYATFTGTYETGNIVQWGYELDGTTADATAKYRWLAHKGMPKADGGTYNDNNWKNPKSNPHTLIPMEAYLKLAADAVNARVYVEDLNEDGTTAIKSISVEDINGMTVDGMYNLQGVKMQSAPTQKGIYINNGKKIIVK